MSLSTCTQPVGQQHASSKSDDGDDVERRPRSVAARDARPATSSLVLSFAVAAESTPAIRFNWSIKSLDDVLAAHVVTMTAVSAVYTLLDPAPVSEDDGGCGDVDATDDDDDDDSSSSSGTVLSSVERGVDAAVGERVRSA